MINVANIFNSVSDLSRKKDAGYTSFEEFNRHLNAAQNVLLRYYYKLFEEAQIVVDSVFPFIVESQLQIEPNAFVLMPADYRYRLEVGYLEIFNPSCDSPTGQPEIKPKPMQYLVANEVMETLASPIRRPSKEKGIYKHSFSNNVMNVYPKDLTGYVNFKYLRDPRPAKYAVTIDVVNRIEVYDPLTSVDPEWLEQDADNLVDLILMYMGLAIRENAIIQWLSQKNQFTTQKAL